MVLKKDESFKIRTFLVSLLFCFVVLFYIPVDVYVTNIEDILISSKYIVLPLAFVSVTALVIIYIVLVRLRQKVYDIVTDVMMGLSAAAYVQGTFLQMNAAELDGSRYEFNFGQAALNILLWAVFVSHPYIIRKISAELRDKLPVFLTALICTMSLSSTLYMVITYDHPIVIDCLANKLDPFVLTVENRYDFSSDHNFIVILVDEYDSFAFDDALKSDPDSSAELHDFTYYSDTLGMYGYSSASLAYIFGNKKLEDTVYSTSFFDTLRDNDFDIELYASNKEFPVNIYEEYTDNYTSYKMSVNDIAKIDTLMYRLGMFKYSPLVIKPLFYATSTDISETVSAGAAYNRDNLSFYNSIPDEYTLTDSKKFKFLYMFGLHYPRETTKDLTRSSEDVSPEEAGIAVNKILSKYISNLRKSGAYDNSDIIILADHGVKSYDSGKHPLLLIKRAGEHRDAMEISDVNVSYADIYPTLLYLAGSDEDLRTVFDLTENDNQERYYADTDEYIYGDITK